ncbi:uncharacterized protein TNCV_186421 [Trichonephila clavipes]|nr:uncharacterized protein TNCV_186421 [Trichonephila clavipes]
MFSACAAWGHSKCSASLRSSPEDGGRGRVPLRHEGTLNSRRAASPLVWLVEGEERREAPDHPQGFLPLDWGGTEQKRTVTCMVLKANDRRKF